MTAAPAQSIVLELGLLAPREAREHARRACAGVTSKRQAEEVRLVVSELVTNAVRHGRGQIRLVLRVRRGEVFVAVQDGGCAFAVPLLVADPFREGGRGLPIVSELASDWAIESLGDAGNVVWCVVHAGARRGAGAGVRPGVAFLLGGTERIDERGSCEPGPPSLNKTAV